MEIISGRALVSDRGSRCTIGAAGYDESGTPHVITAGHAKGAEWHWHGGLLGRTETVEFRPRDCRSIRVEHGKPTPLIDTFRGDFVTVTGFARPEPGLRVVRVGAKSGWTIGQVTHLDQTQCYDLGPCVENLFRTNIRSAKGDSGGPIITEPVDGTARLVGFTSGGFHHRQKGSHTLAQPATTAFEALGLQFRQF